MDKNKRVLIKRTKSGTFCKIAKSAIVLYKFHVQLRQLCTIEWQILQSFKTYLTLFFLSELCYFLSDFDKFGIKIRSRYVCSSWCTQICSILSSFLNILTFTSGKELFLTSLYTSDTYFIYSASMLILSSSILKCTGRGLQYRILTIYINRENKSFS